MFSDGSETVRRPPRSDTIDIGSVVILHSLQSDIGKTANEKRALVLCYHSDLDRWECKVEGRDRTMALKESNMRLDHPRDTETHPEYTEMAMWQLSLAMDPAARRQRKYRSARGVTYEDDPPPFRAQKLVELLDRPDDSYTPNQTILAGEACKYYSVVGEENLSSDCSMYDLEHVAALLALAAMCQGDCAAVGCGDGVPEAVLFALMEAAPRSIDVLMEFVVATPYIGPADKYRGSLETSFRKARNGRVLTPDQTSAAYCHAMKGPFVLLCALAKQKVTSAALIHYLERHKLFPLMIQRLFRIIAREVMGMPDGKVLGKLVRNILACIADFDDKMDGVVFVAICESDASVLSRDAVSKVLREESITSRGELLTFLEECIDRDAAQAFYNTV